MAMIDVPPDFREFLRLLNEADVRYLIVGGYAVAHHGYTRTTNIDVWVAPNPENISRVLAVLRDFGFDDPTLDTWATNPVKALRMGYPPVRIELLTTVTGVTFEEAYPEAVEADWQGLPVKLMGLRALRQNKQAAGRPKDLADLENLANPDDSAS